MRLLIHIILSIIFIVGSSYILGPGLEKLNIDHFVVDYFGILLFLGSILWFLISLIRVLIYWGFSGNNSITTD